MHVLRDSQSVNTSNCVYALLRRVLSCSRSCPRNNQQRLHSRLDISSCCSGRTGTLACSKLMESRSALLPLSLSMPSSRKHESIDLHAEDDFAVSISGNSSSAHCYCTIIIKAFTLTIRITQRRICCLLITASNVVAFRSASSGISSTNGTSAANLSPPRYAMIAGTPAGSI